MCGCQKDKLIDEIAGEIDNIDTLTSYICADFERFIENNGVMRADSLQGCKRTHGLIILYRWFDYFWQLEI